MSSDDDYEADYSKKHFKKRGVDDEEIAYQGGKLLDLVSYSQNQSHKINLDMIDFNHELSHTAYKGIKEAQSMDQSNFVPRKDKKDRATVELVLDPRTRVILVKMLKRNFITEINGCISTGKEANVYHSLTPQGASLAIKIYKTSILVFKDRERYITGEFRFRKGFNKSNPRKMVKLWAEKEYRNLKRIYQSGIPCPEPLIIKSNVLVMEFLGEGTTAAPKLRHANLDSDRLATLYVDLLKMMRTLYHECKLVHADLSEYNVLYWKEKIWLIDVSQSVEHDHPHALDFLRRDIASVNLYFKKMKIETFLIKNIFDYITNSDYTKDKEEDKLEQLFQTKKNTGERDEEEDALFAQTHIPRTLHEVSFKQMEKDMDSNKEKLLYGKLTGLNVDEKEEGEEAGSNGDGDDDDNDESDSEASDVEAEEKKREDGSSDDDDSDSNSGDSDSDSGDSSDNEERKIDESEKNATGAGATAEGEAGADEEKEEKGPNIVLKDKQANKDRKKKIKEENKEKRKVKISKYDKKKKNEKKLGLKANKKK